MSSLLIYYICFGIVLFLFRKQKIYKRIGILILIILSIIRWDIGNDYENYYIGIKNLCQFFKYFNLISSVEILSYEPFHMSIVYAFKDLHGLTELIVIGIYSCLTIILWYKTLERNNLLIWGFFAIFFSGFFFNAWDQMRQSLAIAVFLYSTKYIQSGNITKYSISCVLCICIHYSAIILLPFYLSRYIKLSKWIIAILILIMILGFYSGYWKLYFEKIFLLSDTYSQYTMTKMETQEFGTGLGLISRLIIYVSIIFLNYPKNYILANILLVGLCIYLFSCSNEMIERLSNYGISAIILLLPYTMKSIKINFKINNVLKISIVTLMFLTSTFDNLRGVKGVNPYDTIFSTKYINKEFRNRNY